MAGEALTLQTVHYWNDNMGRRGVNLYAEALNILDGNNTDFWDYEIKQVIIDGKQFLAKQAKLIAASELQVTGEHPPVANLTPNTWYRVYFNITLMHAAKGFKECVIKFEFTDQFGKLKRHFKKLDVGLMPMYVGEFFSKPGFNKVKAKMYDNNGQEKSGLYVHCLRIVPVAVGTANPLIYQVNNGGRGQGQNYRNPRVLGGWQGGCGRGRGYVHGQRRVEDDSSSDSSSSEDDDEDKKYRFSLEFNFGRN